MWDCCNGNPATEDIKFEKQMKQTASLFKNRMSIQQSQPSLNKNDQHSSKLIKKSLGINRRKTENATIIKNSHQSLTVHQIQGSSEYPVANHKFISPMHLSEPPPTIYQQQAKMVNSVTTGFYHQSIKTIPTHHQKYYVPPSITQQPQKRAEHKVPPPVHIHSFKNMAVNHLKPEKKTQQNDSSDHLKVEKNSFFMSSSRKLTELQFKHTESIGECSNIESDISVVIDGEKKQNLFMSHLLSQEENPIKGKNNGTKGSQIGTDVERSSIKSPGKRGKNIYY